MSHMKKILVTAAILLLMFATVNGLSFDGRYQVKKVEQIDTLHPVQIGFTDSMPADLENEDGSSRILKLPEPTLMFLLGFGLLVLGRFGRKKFKS